jgi:hypothetical protein
MGLIRRTLVAVTGVAMSLPVMVMPAIALPMATSDADCPAGKVAAAPYAAGRGAGAAGKHYEPVLDQSSKPLPAKARGKAPGSFSATVDVYFHVITDGTAGSLTNKMISDQIRVLNKTYGGQEGGSYTGFTFRLAGVTRTNDAHWYAAKSGAEHQFKKALKRGNDGDMNVYSTSGDIYLGWAYYPSITESKNQSYLDGIVIDWRTVPGASDAYAGAYDQGETLTHEAGHWLYLAHTFEGGCSEPGDFVADTPAMSVPTGGCPEGKDTCPQPGLDPIHNYMDYSFDSCYTEFTDGQTQRMRDSWLLYRAD